MPLNFFCLLFVSAEETTPPQGLSLFFFTGRFIVCIRNVPLVHISRDEYKELNLTGVTDGRSPALFWSHLVGVHLEES